MRVSSPQPTMVSGSLAEIFNSCKLRLINKNLNLFNVFICISYSPSVIVRKSKPNKSKSNNLKYSINEKLARELGLRSLYIWPCLGGRKTIYATKRIEEIFLMVVRLENTDSRW